MYHICYLMERTIMAYLRKRGRKFHFRQRVPKRFLHLFPKEFVQVSLDTDSEALAQQRAHSFRMALDDFWQQLALSNGAQAHKKFHAAVSLAKLHGFQYVAHKQLAENHSTSQLVNRINVAGGSNQMVRKAVLGVEPSPTIKLSNAQEIYFDHEIGNKTGRSDNQIRKWKNPIKRAVQNFIDQVEDKTIDQIRREDVLSFRDWWIERIKSEGKATNSANKDFGHIRRILNTASDHFNLNLPIDQLFRNVNLQRMEKTRRYPFETAFIQDVLLRPDSLNLNRECILFIHAMADTGARISELAGLENEDIILTGNLPHIKIRPNKIRGLKNKPSERDIPLVGSSLFAFEQLAGSFKRYLGKADLISNTINKYCRENSLFPSKHYSLYSLRHSFEDRLTAVEPPDKVQAALMGHKYTRERYGHGPGLEQKKLWLDKIAFTVE